MMRLGVIVVAIVLLSGCSGCQSSEEQSTQENLEAKSLLQGVWVDAETEDLTFRVAGDTIFYADTTSMPAYFKIVGDSLVLSSGTTYAIEQHTAHIFSFRNQNGDLVKLVKSDEAEAVSDFTHVRPSVMTYTHQVKKDSVVNFGGERYHWYIAINPTRFKVTHHTFNEDGMEVENVYYDNIIHLSIFNGSTQIFSRDFRKPQYEKKVPAQFLTKSILNNMEYDKTDAEGFHVNASLCTPGNASCYMVGHVISFDGKLTTKLLEY